MKQKRVIDSALITILMLSLHSMSLPGLGAESNSYDKLAAEAKESLERGVSFYHSIANEGGYVFFYSLDLKHKWGERLVDDRTIEVQPPGTPAVGMSFLRAYRVVNNPIFLKAAEDAANALIGGQNDLGGWQHTIHFDHPNDPESEVSFDDDQTQSAVRFLMALDDQIDNPDLRQAVEKALWMMLESQLPHGGWPHVYPKQGNYHDFATFNDGGINDCLSVMMDAHRIYGGQAYLDAVNKTGWFIILSQLAPPQPGWAQQYNDYLQPAWARAFEPPSVCPHVTIRNLETLMDLYLYTGKDRYLEPIPDALVWLHSSRLPNGKWPRFIEIGTGRPLYYDRGRIRVNSTDELSLERRMGYAYESDLTNLLQMTEKRFERITELSDSVDPQKHDRQLSRKEILEKLEALQKEVAEVISSQDDSGRWIVKSDRYRKRVPDRLWDGQYETRDRISSKLFNKNVEILCRYLELFLQTQSPDN